MNYFAAKRLFTREKLQFGNLNHIQARNVLRLWEEYLELFDNPDIELPDCTTCSGYGEFEEEENNEIYYQECSVCHGRGYIQPNSSTDEEDLREVVRYMREQYERLK